MHVDETNELKKYIYSQAFLNLISYTFLSIFEIQSLFWEVLYFSITI